MTRCFWGGYKALQNDGRCPQPATMSPVIVVGFDDDQPPVRIGWGGPVCDFHRATLATVAGFAADIGKLVLGGPPAPPAHYTAEWRPCDADGKPVSHSCARMACIERGVWRGLLMHNGEEIGQMLGLLCATHRDEVKLAPSDVPEGVTTAWVEVVL